MINQQINNANNPNFIWTYNDDIISQILSEITHFKADFGGTNILDPLKKVTEASNFGDKKLRVFLLTDGEVDNKD